MQSIWEANTYAMHASTSFANFSGRLLRHALRLETNQRPSIPNSHSLHQKIIPITPGMSRVNAALVSGEVNVIIRIGKNSFAKWSVERRKFDKGVSQIASFKVQLPFKPLSDPFLFSTCRNDGRKFPPPTSLFLSQLCY